MNKVLIVGALLTFLLTGLDIVVGVVTYPAIEDCPDWLARWVPGGIVYWCLVVDHE